MFRRLRTVLGVVALGACEFQPAGLEGGTGELQIHAAVNSPTISTLVVEVTADDLTDPLIFNFTLVDAVARGTIEVPAGARRTVAVRAYDVGGMQTHSGEATILIRPGLNPTLRITLRPLNGQQPIEIVLGSFIVIVKPEEAVVAQGDALQVDAEVLDADGRLIGDSKDVVWATDAPAIASVDAVGMVKALLEGSARIVASFGGVAGVAKITVVPR